MVLVKFDMLLLKYSIVGNIVLLLEVMRFVVPVGCIVVMFIWVSFVICKSLPIVLYLFAIVAIVALILMKNMQTHADKTCFCISCLLFVVHREILHFVFDACYFFFDVTWYALVCWL